ncbi:MAG: DUF3768 domain-containing protein [Nitrospirota bacterium]|nr:DUF3768 domain-containing protein [Nitrospirota bacterium]
MTDEKTIKIRELNDLARKQTMLPIFGAHVPCKVLYTAGIQALGAFALVEIAAMVRDYDTFTEDNDPYGEGDFGSFSFNDDEIFWKIDYYDLDLKYGSENPADINQTMRVLTIMLSSEY